MKNIIMLNRLKTTYNHYTHMSYNILSNGSYLPAGTAPTGSLSPYIGASGNTDPSGWVICDGQPRTINDSRYNNVTALGIGSTAGGNYTPPDLRAMYLRGAGTAGNTAYAGGSINTFQDQMLINHGHTYPPHGHTTLDNPGNTYFAAKLGNPTIRDATNADRYNLVNSYLDITATTTVTSSVTISNSPSVNTPNAGSDTRTFNYGVNWILKL